VSLAHLMVTLTGASVAVYGAMMAIFATVAARRRRRPAVSRGAAPPISIFKPLAGCDDDLDANLESFAALDYPCFEILFGVASTSDPAFAVARRFVARHPELDARVLVTDPGAALNPKVAQLIGLERAAKGDVYVISDSNVRVRPTYLTSLASELGDARVGLVTSLFAGTGERTVGAALENLQICAATTPGIVAMGAVGKPLSVGKSMALRRRDLERLGGFASVGHVLAEDDRLGQRILDDGLAVRTSFDVVENRNVDCTVSRTLDRHTRWARIRRSLNPVAVGFEPLLQPIVVASVAVVAAPSVLTAVTLAVVCIGQSACALLATRLLRGHALPWRYAPLEIVRSYATLACWIGAFASQRIVWRGHTLVVQPGSVIALPSPVSGRAVAREGAVA
jgi:ceramide glucosyltransferase